MAEDGHGVYLQVLVHALHDRRGLRPILKIFACSPSHLPRRPRAVPLHDFFGTIAARVAHPREADILAQLLDPQDIVMRAVNP